MNNIRKLPVEKIPVFWYLIMAEQHIKRQVSSGLSRVYLWEGRNSVHNIILEEISWKT